MQAEQLLTQQYPGLEVVSSNYPVPAYKVHLARLVSGVQMAAIGLTVFGDQVFQSLSVRPPDIYNSMKENKVGTVAGNANPPRLGENWRTGNRKQSVEP